MVNEKKYTPLHGVPDWSELRSKNSPLVFDLLRVSLTLWRVFVVLCAVRPAVEWSSGTNAGSSSLTDLSSTTKVCLLFSVSDLRPMTQTAVTRSPSHLSVFIAHKKRSSIWSNFTDFFCTLYKIVSLNVKWETADLIKVKGQVRCDHTNTWDLLAGACTLMSEWLYFTLKQHING